MFAARFHCFAGCNFLPLLARFQRWSSQHRATIAPMLFSRNLEPSSVIFTLTCTVRCPKTYELRLRMFLTRIASFQASYLMSGGLWTSHRNQVIWVKCSEFNSESRFEFVRALGLCA